MLPSPTQICFCLALGINVQGQNALDFDGIDDFVIVPNASSLITTGTGISFGLWVYPRNVAPAFPNFDSFGGFRNNTDAITSILIGKKDGIGGFAEYSQFALYGIKGSL